MGYVKCWTTVAVILFIASCSSPPPPKNNVFDPLTQQMDKARDVQEKNRKAIDNQERGEPNR
jgi:PBP1b-binding outer membrane lipoprotein LpoB